MEVSSSSSSSSIPFSWESSPGIPKRSSNKPNSSNPSALLPLPPPLRSSSTHSYSHRQQIKKDMVAVVDPFVMAFLECSKEERKEKDSSRKMIAAGRRVFGFMSCKSGPISVVDSIAFIRQKRSSSTGDIMQ